MIYVEMIYIRVEWSPSSGQFVCSGETEEANLVEEAELRKLLFAWHEGSGYGLQLKATSQKQGLLLSPYLAVDYLAEPRPLLHGRLVWTNEALWLQQLAKLLREVMAKRWYKPSYTCWREGKSGWKLDVPENWRQLLEVLEAGDMREAEAYDFAETWLNLAMHEYLARPEGAEVSRGWEGRAEAHADLLKGLKDSGAVTANEWMLEEDWLTAIGWREDTTPFRVCLQLVEPYAETYVDGSTSAKDDAAEWRLRFVVQDRLDSNRFVEMNANGTRLHAQQLIPTAWLPMLNDKVSEQIAKIIRVCPRLESDYQPGKLSEGLSDDEAWTFLTTLSFQLVGAGISLFLPSWWDDVQRQKPQLRAKLKSTSHSRSGKPVLGMDHLLAYDWRIALGRVVLAEHEFRELAEQKKRLIYLRGKWVQLDPALVDQIKAAMRQMGKKKTLSIQEVLGMYLPEGGEVIEELPAPREKAVPFQVRVELNRHMQALVKGLQKTQSIPQIGTVEGLQAELRPYQREGVSWLLFLRRMGLGGCLADDMGLGKTIQYIAYLLQTKAEEGRAPSLLICPTSVLGNWQKELERFAPSLQVHLHYGPQRLRGEFLTEAVRRADLVITSYPLALSDVDELAQMEWRSLCLDEAQNIKNAYTKQAVAIRTFTAQHRIALTGTPMENRLTELWSIMDWLNPGYLGSRSHFQQLYVGPIEKGGDGAAELALRVQRLVRPFVLRRVKKDPAIRLSLPEKSEVKAYVALTPEQGALYETVVQRLMEKLDDATGIEKKGLILSALTKLKMICDHPALFLKEAEVVHRRAAARSAKLARLLEMLDELRREDGGGCLIFTQFVRMGALLQAVLQQELGEPVQFLHGGLGKAERDAMVARFQDEALPAGERSRIFVLSLKAGGTGLNLTAANHVFHFDRWWNPAVENQATDRAFRIGQTRDVQVHKFVTLGTLEERIDAMIARKQGLSELIVGSGESWITELSTGELRELFALRREWVEE
ncbi:DEAD/DEAH box helicase [Paenibacillus roseipurpureus]|uniref:DEAD/DEAH box helicase n=1 Tax=Paenibacillus roseopurpureus TaxID=2918901 RepID=A0AA96LQC5_9BACL|nr:DEAD/DEAH box helicase [Paenibacillus sp. MBLB1832]WNR43888.1 DEAD/DEAH box helicase [Paenibacillus sp. MBLB1832]